MLKKELVEKVEEQEREIKLLSAKLKLKNHTIDNYSKRNNKLDDENSKLAHKIYQIEQVILNPTGFPILKWFGLKRLIKKVLEDGKDISIT